MGRIANTKIVFEDGSVQWVLERTVGEVTYFENVYLTTQMIKHREYCAMKLRNARRDLKWRTKPVITWQTQMLMQQIISTKDAVMMFTS